MLGGNVGPWTLRPRGKGPARAGGEPDGPRAGRLAPGLDQRPHPARRSIEAAGSRSSTCRTSFTAGGRTTRTTPIWAIWRWPTGSSSPATACRCWSRRRRPAKPVLVFDLARGPGSRRPPLPANGSIRRAGWQERLRGFRLQPVWYRLGQLAGPAQLRRDVGVIHRRQIAAGRAAWLGDAMPDPGAVAPLADTERAAARVRALLGLPQSDGPPAPGVLDADLRVLMWRARATRLGGERGHRPCG